MQDYNDARNHVYMVDTHSSYPPVPPRLVPSPPLPPLPPPPPPPRGGQSCQVVIIMLMFLMFCGLTIQAVFLYRLYPTAAGTTATTATITADSVSNSKMTQDKGCGSPATKGPVKPSKPVAHLTDGPKFHRASSEIMSWSTNGYSFLHEMHYRDGQLFVNKEGYYYIYSKVFFVERAVFHHSVSLNSHTYPLKSMNLLKATKYSNPYSLGKSNSYLGGVFHLIEGDAICVQVNNSSQIIYHFPNENVFGAYMI